MATTVKKYLDLEGLETLVSEIKSEDAKKVDKLSSDQTHSSALYKIATNAQGQVISATAVAKADITALQIPGEDTNQKVKADSVTFGNNDVIDIVGGDNISVTGLASGTGAPKITIAYTGAATDHNQTVKSGSVTFGADEIINIKADTTSGNPITVTGNATNKEITIKHGTTTAASAAAVKVGKDEWGHVVLGSQIQYSEIGGTPTIGDATLTIQANGTSKGTFKANATTDATINITAADLGLESAMHFKGKFDSLPAVTNYSAGDVVLVGTKEYVLNEVSGTKSWVELGDEGSHALKTITITGTNGLTGGGTLEANRTISHSTYNSATAAAIAVGRDEYGHVVIGSALGTADAGAHTHTVTGSVSVANTVTAKSDKYLKVATTNSDSFVKSYSPTSSKLATTSIAGVSGSTTASKATAGTAVVYGTADVGTAVTYGTADVDTAVTYGTADRASSATTVITACSLNGTAYSASYDSTNSCLELTALTLTATPGSVYEAVNSNKTLTPAKASTKTLTPAKAADTTRTITPYTFSNVTVPVAASAVTVATGSLSDSGSGASVVTGLGTPTTGTAIGSVSISAEASSSTGAVAFVQSITTGSTSANLADGTAVSAGTHSHTVTGGSL